MSGYRRIWKSLGNGMNKTVYTQERRALSQPRSPGHRRFKLPVTAALLRIDSPDEIIAERYTLEEES